MYVMVPVKNLVAEFMGTFKEFSPPPRVGEHHAEAIDSFRPQMAPFRNFDVKKGRPGSHGRPGPMLRDVRGKSWKSTSSEAAGLRPSI